MNDNVAPFVEENEAVTMQSLFGASDGLVLATDALTVWRQHQITVDPNLDVRTCHVEERGVLKVLLDTGCICGIACSGNAMRYEFVESCVSSLGRIWDGGIVEIRRLIQEKWLAEPDRWRRAGSLVLFNAKRRNAFKVGLGNASVEPAEYALLKHQLGFVLNGDVYNPAGMILARYFPRMCEVNADALLLLAAHHILTAGQINPQYISGLRICVSRKERPFEWLTEDELQPLIDASEKLHTQTEKLLLARRRSS